MTTEQVLNSIVGWVLSAILKYIPVVRNRFDRLSGLGKRLAVISTALLVSVAVFVLRCGGFSLPIELTCTRSGLVDFLNIALTVAINSQAAYLLLPEPAGKPPKSTYPDPFPPQV